MSGSEPEPLLIGFKRRDVLLKKGIKFPPPLDDPSFCRLSDETNDGCCVQPNSIIEEGWEWDEVGLLDKLEFRSLKAISELTVVPFRCQGDIVCCEPGDGTHHIELKSRTKTLLSEIEGFETTRNERMVRSPQRSFFEVNNEPKSFWYGFLSEVEKARTNIRSNMNGRLDSPAGGSLSLQKSNNIPISIAFNSNGYFRISGPGNISDCFLPSRDPSAHLTEVDFALLSFGLYISDLFNVAALAKDISMVWNMIVISLNTIKPSALTRNIKLFHIVVKRGKNIAEFGIPYIERYFHVMKTLFINTINKYWSAGGYAIISNEVVRCFALCMRVLSRHNMFHNPFDVKNIVKHIMDLALISLKSSDDTRGICAWNTDGEGLDKICSKCQLNNNNCSCSSRHIDETIQDLAAFCLGNKKYLATNASVTWKVIQDTFNYLSSIEPRVYWLSFRDSIIKCLNNDVTLAEKIFSIVMIYGLIICLRKHGGEKYILRVILMLLAIVARNSISCLSPAVSWVFFHFIRCFRHFLSISEGHWLMDSLLFLTNYMDNEITCWNLLKVFSKIFSNPMRWARPYLEKIFNIISAKVRCMKTTDILYPYIISILVKAGGVLFVGCNHWIEKISDLKGESILEVPETKFSGAKELLMFRRLMAKAICRYGLCNPELTSDSTLSWLNNNILTCEFNKCEKFSIVQQNRDYTLPSALYPTTFSQNISEIDAFKLLLGRFQISKDVRGDPSSIKDILHFSKWIIKTFLYSLRFHSNFLQGNRTIFIINYVWVYIQICSMKDRKPSMAAYRLLAEITNYRPGKEGTEKFLPLFCGFLKKEITERSQSSLAPLAPVESWVEPCSPGEVEKTLGILDKECLAKKLSLEFLYYGTKHYIVSLLNSQFINKITIMTEIIEPIISMLNITINNKDECKKMMFCVLILADYFSKIKHIPLQKIKNYFFYPLRGISEFVCRIILLGNKFVKNSLEYCPIRAEQYSNSKRHNAGLYRLIKELYIILAKILAQFVCYDNYYTNILYKGIIKSTLEELNFTGLKPYFAQIFYVNMINISLKEGKIPYLFEDILWELLPEFVKIHGQRTQFRNSGKGMKSAKMSIIGSLLYFYPSSEKIHRRYLLKKIIPYISDYIERDRKEKLMKHPERYVMLGVLKTILENPKCEKKNRSDILDLVINYAVEFGDRSFKHSVVRIFLEYYVDQSISISDIKSSAVTLTELILDVLSKEMLRKRVNIDNDSSFKDLIIDIMHNYGSTIIRNILDKRHYFTFVSLRSLLKAINFPEQDILFDSYRGL